MHIPVLLLVAALFTSASVEAAQPLSVAEESAILATVDTYTAALATGDVQTLKRLLSSRLGSKRKDLYNNATYPQFLVEYFDGASFTNSRVIRSLPGEATVEVTMDTGDGGILKRAVVVTYNPQGRRLRIASDLPIAE